MATYIVLINWTDKGIANAADSPNRATAVASALRKAGGRVRDTYWTIGPYDAVSVVDAPDDETFTAWLLQVAAEGYVRTTSLRAFDRKEMGTIFGRLTG
jgi:uncharacterized protein with GYD domain